MSVPPEAMIPAVNELIGVQGGDETVAKLQLAARWAERFSAPTDDLTTMLARFRRAYDYLDAVTHGIEPDNA